jgi:hypothetical protein
MTYTGAVAKGALVDLLTTTLAPVPVVYGPPARFLGDEIVTVRDVLTVRDAPRLGPNRTADEVHQVDVTVTVSVANTTDQRTVTERAVTLVNAADTALRTVAGQNLGAAAQSAGIYLGWIVGDIVLTETTDEDATLGRQCAVAFSVEARSRRT